MRGCAADDERAHAVVDSAGAVGHEPADCRRGRRAGGRRNEPIEREPYGPRTSALLNSRAADAGCTGTSDAATNTTINHMIFFMGVLLGLPVRLLEAALAGVAV